MSEASPSADLEAAVLTILREHPEGLSEFALFAELAKRGFSAFEREVFADRMRMFRSHFVLFHVLYAVRDTLLVRGEGHLTVEALSIRLTPWSDEREREVSLAEHDPLRDYYLDLANLDAMTEEELRSMLDRFWERLGAGDRETEALRVFGLERGTPWEDIKARHRELVLEHHPDRGGDAARLVEVNAAMRVLEVLRRRR